MALLDTLSVRAIKDGGLEYLKALDAIGKVGDGYVSEGLMDIIGNQFYHNFDNLITYCYSSDGCLQRLTIEALSMEMSMSENRILKAKEIDKYVRQQIAKQKYNSSKTAYIDQLLKAIDPKMFDE